MKKTIIFGSIAIFLVGYSVLTSAKAQEKTVIEKTVKRKPIIKNPYVCLQALEDIGSPVVPQSIVRRIMLTESQYYIGGRVLPNPYALNIAGDGSHPKTKSAALKKIKKAEERGIRNIDRGCMQINFKAHPKAFKNHEESLDPEANIRYGVSFLSSLYRKDLCFVGRARKLINTPGNQIPRSLRAWHDRMRGSKINQVVACYHNAADPIKQIKYLTVFDKIK